MRDVARDALRAMERLVRTARHLIAPAAASGDRNDEVATATALETTMPSARPRTHLPGAIPPALADSAWVERVAALHELVPMAKSKLLKQDWEFMRGGSDAEASVRRNRLELDSLALRPSMLEDVSSINLSIELFGATLSFPIITAPMGGALRWDSQGACACARAASTSGVMSCLSSLADGLLPGPTSSLEATAASCSGPKIFQLYVRGDDDFVDDHARRAIAAGYTAFAITVDVQLVSRREGMITSRYQKAAGSASGGAQGLDYQSQFSWAKLERFKSRWPQIPLLIKGIMTGADAARCVEMGCEGVWVSNHGGRQLDQTQGTMAVLPEIVKAVGGRAKVVIDGGFLRGTDIIKAMALGADAVALGRLTAVALSAGGEQGLVRALDLLLEETHTAMGLMSKRTWSELTPDDVVPAPYGAAGPPDLFSGFPYLQSMDGNFGQMRW
eukprot:COSAG02_NODE_1406_length_12786_cov_5.493418_4_plen_445_part_00